MLQESGKPSSRFSVNGSQKKPSADNWETRTDICYANSPCGEFRAGSLEYSCWSCSRRASDRSRWPALPSRKRCIACGSRIRRHGSRCHHAMGGSMMGGSMTGGSMMGGSMMGGSMSMPAASMPAASQNESATGDSSPSSSEASFRAVDNCCQDHNCCCCMGTSEWAQPASGLPSSFRLLIEPVYLLRRVEYHSSEIESHDSARAPPRS